MLAVACAVPWEVSQGSSRVELEWEWDASMGSTHLSAAQSRLPLYRCTWLCPNDWDVFERA